MAVNNSKVHKYIQDALDNNSNGSVEDRLINSFYNVNALRTDQCQNQDLTAADHYLISRWVVLRCSPAVSTVLLALITGYDGFYKGLNEITKYQTGTDIVFTTGHCPASSFSPSIVLWAATGVSDGNVDWTESFVQSPTKLYAPKAPIGYFHRLFR
jgi:hypothetical protein